MEATLSEDLTPKSGGDVDHEKLSREELLALLRDVTEHRDKLLSQYEAMALEVNEATREIDDARLDAQHSARKAEDNARKAEDNERRAEQENSRANQLARQLDEERVKSAGIAAEFARFREQTAHPPIEDPWCALLRAASQILSNGVAWVRAKIPPDSPLLPWFDRIVQLAKTTGRLAFEGSKVLLAWAKPRLIEIWKWLEGEVSRRVTKK